MKARQQRFSVGAYIAAIITGLTFCASVNAARLCELVLDCPANYANDTVEVPDSIVALARIFEHCSPYFIEEGSNIDHTDTVSVMFVIDHSSSMSIMDSTNVRYAVVEKLIDSLHFYSPASEVGIAVFSNQLLHDYHDDAFFVPLDTSNGWHDSYIPLTNLSSTVESMSAVEKLKWAIAVSTTVNDTDAGGNQRLLHAQYGKTGRTDGHALLDSLNLTVEAAYNGATDISLGFEAAQKAFLSAANPANRQYIIFLSDGIAQEVDRERRPYKDDYISGDSIPTTFSVFWINRSGDQNAPQQIQDMTDSIRTNGYSFRNIYSALWTTYGSEVDLFTGLLNIVKGTGLQVTTTYPTSFAIDSINAVKIDDSLVYFDQPFGLNAGYTTFTYDITYHYGEPFNRDTVTQFTVTIHRVAGARLYTGMETRCWDQGPLAIYYGGSAVTRVEPEWTNLDVRFTPSVGQSVDAASFYISNGAGTDYLNRDGVNQGTFFNAPFQRMTGTAVVDSILQTSTGDSIIVIYRNPAIPMDTLRIVVPVGIPRDLKVTSAYYLDQKGGIANGYPDILRLIIADTLSADEMNLIKSHIQLTTLVQRGFSISSLVATPNGIDILLTEPSPLSVAPFTGTYPSERLYIDSIPSLSQGGSFPRVDITIADSMAPVIVSASYYDRAAVADTLRVTFSEDILWVGDATPFRFNRKTDIAEYEIIVTPSTSDSATAVFIIGPNAGAVLPQFGDSIWIDSLANVSDANRVRQDGANVRRLLNYLLQYTIQSAAYHDPSGDGLIDIVDIKTDRAPDQQMATAVSGTISTWLPTFRDFSVDSVVPTSDGFRVYVSQPPTTTPSTVSTTGDSLVSTNLTSSNNGYIPAATVGISDNLPPVILEATFMPGIVRSAGQTAPDTLKVVFSEKVPMPASTQPFLLYDGEKGGAVYTMELAGMREGSASTYYFLVQSSEKQFPLDTDSIRINPAANIADADGNVQNSATNRKVRLVLRPYRYYFVVKAAPNPGDPAIATVPPSIASLAGTSRGLAVLAQPLDSMATSVTANAKLRIYDAVGNVVWKSERGVVDPVSRRIAFVWDGTNRENGRFVGSGSYLGIIEIEDNQGFAEVQRVWIGVAK